MNPFCRLFTLMTKPVTVLLVITVLILSFIYIDRPLSEYLDNLQMAVNAPWLSWFTSLGASYIYLFAFLLAWAFFRYVKPNPLWQERCLFLWLCAALAEAICFVLKISLGRARPEMWFTAHDYGFYWLQTKYTFWSFPSGHTMIIMALAFGFSLIFPLQAYLFIIFGVLIALSRLLLVKHYLSDVLAASCLALLEVGLLLQVLKKKSYLQQAWNKG